MYDKRPLLGMLGAILQKLLPVILMDHELAYRDIRLLEIALSQACIGRVFHPVLRFDISDTSKFGTVVEVWVKL
jgi:hypothetical protein